GVFTVVAMMALLNGLQHSLDKSMSQLGADVFQIQRGPSFSFGPLSADVLARKKLTLSQVRQLRESLPEAKQEAGEMWEGGKGHSDGTKINQGAQVAGGTTEFFTNNNLPIGTGRGFNEGEALDGAHVVVIGSGVAETLFSREDPLGKHIRLGRMDLEVI